MRVLGVGRWLGEAGCAEGSGVDGVDLVAGDGRGAVLEPTGLKGLRFAGFRERGVVEMLRSRRRRRRRRGLREGGKTC